MISNPKNWNIKLSREFTTILQNIFSKVRGCCLFTALEHSIYVLTYGLSDKVMYTHLSCSWRSKVIMTTNCTFNHETLMQIFIGISVLKHRRTPFLKTKMQLCKKNHKATEDNFKKLMGR